jgi:nucleotide-binding universal stress UspA family protein
MNIVLAVDFSAQSEVAVSEIIARMWPAGTVVHVFHVMDLFALTSSVGYYDTFIARQKHEARELARSIAARLQKRGLETTTRIVEGYPGTGIARYAKEVNADFIFVGSHGHSGIARLLLGSVAKLVVQNAQCSVEIARVSTRKDGMKILLATDGSDYSLAAARSAAQRPWPDGSEFKVVSVIDLAVPAMDPWYAAGEVIDRLREEHAKLSQDAVRVGKKIVVNAGLTATDEVLTGTPKWRILDEAIEWEANLIVVGSHGRRGITRLLMGSVSEAVALHAHCSVEVIRERALLNRE